MCPAGARSKGVKVPDLLVNFTIMKYYFLLVKNIHYNIDFVAVK